MSRRRLTRGSSYISVEVEGLDALRTALRPLLEPEITKAFDEVNKAGAKAYAKALRPAVRSASTRMARAVRVKRAKTGKPDWVVGSKRKVAFFWPFVIAGTKDHGPKKAKALVWKGPNGWVRSGRVRGMTENPIVERIAKANEARIAREIDINWTRKTGL